MAAIGINELYTRLGYNPYTIVVLQGEGFVDLDVFGELIDDDLDSMIRTLARRTFPPVINIANVTFPIRATVNMKSLGFWVREQERIGALPIPNDFTVQVMDVYKHRMKEDKEYVESRKGDKHTPPDAIKSIVTWAKFKNLMTTYLGQLRGVALCPLTYVVREVAEVLDADRAAVYATAQDRLARCTTHLGTWYQVDNQRVYDELKPLVYDGSLWPFVQRFDQTRNGRGAWLALVIQSEGRANNNLRKTRAYADIAAAKYQGERRNFTFVQYVALHQKAHNELDELGESISETKKVTDFLAGINSQEMITAKQVVMGDEVRLESFDLTQTYLTNFVNTQTTQQKASRNVAEVQTGKRGGGGKGNNFQKKKGGSGRIHAGTYSPEEWNALSFTERDEVRALRQQNPTKKQRGNPNQQHGQALSKLKKENAKLRKAAAAATVESDDSAPEDDVEVIDQAGGNQFGPKAHGQKQKGKKK
jgi:hypothetical protein